MSEVNVNDLATKYLAERHVVHWHNTFWVYDDKSYPAFSESELDYDLRLWMVHNNINPTIGKISNLIRQIAAMKHRSGHMPSWVGGGEGRPDPLRLVNFDNGLVDLDTGGIGPHDEHLFSSNSLPYAYDPGASCPKWMAFLKDSLVDGDQIGLAQEWFGYNLVLDNRYQKFMLLHGPTGAGKGVLTRMLTAMLGGYENVGAVTLQGLGGGFGLEGLVGRQAAVITEIELGRDSKFLVQVLKSITGNDPVEINRKYQAPYTGSLPVRFTVSANKIPKLPDSSNALAGRMLVLHFPKSFRNTAKENPYLEDSLMEELPAIALWAMGGLRRLRGRGRFEQSERGKADLQDFKELAAPALGFTDAWCELDPEGWSLTDDLYTCWCRYCHDDGHEAGSKTTFINNLKAAFPGVVRQRKRTEGKNVWGYHGISLNGMGRKLVSGVF